MQKRSEGIGPVKQLSFFSSQHTQAESPEPLPGALPLPGIPKGTVCNFSQLRAE